MNQGVLEDLLRTICSLQYMLKLSDPVVHLLQANRHIRAAAVGCAHPC